MRWRTVSISPATSHIDSIHHVAPASASGPTIPSQSSGSSTGVTPSTTMSNGEVCARCSFAYLPRSRTSSAVNALNEPSISSLTGMIRHTGAPSPWTPGSAKLPPPRLARVAVAPACRASRNPSGRCSVCRRTGTVHRSRNAGATPGTHRGAPPVFCGLPSRRPCRIRYPVRRAQRAGAPCLSKAGRAWLPRQAHTAELSPLCATGRLNHASRLRAAYTSVEANDDLAFSRPSAWSSVRTRLRLFVAAASGWVDPMRELNIIRTSRSDVRPCHLAPSAVPSMSSHFD